MDKKEATEKINEILNSIHLLYREAEKIADEAHINFYTSGPTYGMGGHYEPALKRYNDALNHYNKHGYYFADWGRRTEAPDMEDFLDENPWQASSHSC